MWAVVWPVAAFLAAARSSSEPRSRQQFKFDRLGKTLSIGSASLKGHYPALVVLFLALVLRLAHLAQMMGGPLTFELGPEEAD